MKLPDGDFDGGMRLMGQSQDKRDDVAKRRRGRTGDREAARRGYTLWNALSGRDAPNDGIAVDEHDLGEATPRLERRERAFHQTL